jgi:hypothetical protein
MSEAEPAERLSVQEQVNQNLDKIFREEGKRSDPSSGDQGLSVSRSDRGYFVKVDYEGLEEKLEITLKHARSLAEDNYELTVTPEGQAPQVYAYHRIEGSVLDLTNDRATSLRYFGHGFEEFNNFIAFIADVQDSVLEDQEHEKQLVAA